VWRTGVSEIHHIDPAAVFVAARQERRTLSSYPGDVPPDLATAYAVQERALAIGRGQIAGWKIAAIRPEFRARYDAPRLVGPIFQDKVWSALPGEPVDAPVFGGGFAAVEAEFAFLIGTDLPPRSSSFDAAEVAAAVASLHGAIEVASSPLATLNDLGPGAVIADHGNNAGLITGPAIPDWARRAPEDLMSRMVIDGRTVGEGSAATVPGGPIEALLFLANHLATRGRFLRAGDWVSSGATTGIHMVTPGSRGRAEFGRLGAIDFLVVAA
jgi:2-keto-4-pentenoate hydratase